MVHRLSRSHFAAVALGLLLGAGLAPSLARAADRLEINWPSIFRVEVARSAPVEVHLDRYHFPELKVNIEKLPPIRLENGRALGTTFAPLHEAAGATLFVACEPDGQCRILRLDHQTAKVTALSEFEL